ncbi:MAG: hypothetical protein ACP5NV_05325 [Candidatus Woesearchaeota archaeon]
MKIIPLHISYEYHDPFDGLSNLLDNNNNRIATGSMISKTIDASLLEDINKNKLYDPKTFGLNDNKAYGIVLGATPDTNKNSTKRIVAIYELKQ